MRIVKSLCVSVRYRFQRSIYTHDIMNCMRVNGHEAEIHAEIGTAYFYLPGNLSKYKLDGLLFENDKLRCKY